MNLIVYKITNKINQKCYIGITTRALSQRWAEHCSASRRNSKKAIHRAINKYGQNNFNVEIIDTATSLEELYAKEQQLIKQYESFNTHKGYNCTSGGEFFVMTPEERLKRSKRMLGIKHSEITKKRISETKKNYPFIITDEYREKQRIASTGRKHSPESIEKTASKNRGKKRTIEQRAKFGIKNTGKKHSEEHKAKISKSLVGTHNKPFTMFKTGICLGVFDNIKQFCDQYDLNEVSTSKILRKLIIEAKEYSGYRLDNIKKSNKMETI